MSYPCKPSCVEFLTSCPPGAGSELIGDVGDLGPVADVIGPAQNVCFLLISAGHDW